MYGRVGFHDWSSWVGICKAMNVKPKQQQIDSRVLQMLGMSTKWSKLTTDAMHVTGNRAGGSWLRKPVGRPHDGTMSPKCWTWNYKNLCLPSGLWSWLGLIMFLLCLLPFRMGMCTLCYCILEICNILKIFTMAQVKRMLWVKVSIQRGDFELTLLNMFEGILEIW